MGIIPSSTGCPLSDLEGSKDSKDTLVVAVTGNIINTNYVGTSVSHCLTSPTAGVTGLVLKALKKHPDSEVLSKCVFNLLYYLASDPR